MNSNDGNGSGTPPTDDQAPEQPEQPGRERERKQEERSKMAELDVLQSELRRARDEAAEYRKKAKEAEDALDKADAKIKKLESTATDVAEKHKAEVEKLGADLKAAGEWKTKFDEQQETIKTGLLERIPEDKREKYESMTLETLQAVIDDVAPQQQAPANSPENGPAGDNPGGNNYDPSKMTMEQMLSLDESTVGQLIDKQYTGGPGTIGTL